MEMFIGKPERTEVMLLIPSYDSNALKKRKNPKKLKG